MKKDEETAWIESRADRWQAWINLVAKDPEMRALTAELVRRMKRGLPHQVLPIEQRERFLKEKFYEKVGSQEKVSRSEEFGKAEEACCDGQE